MSETTNPSDKPDAPAEPDPAATKSGATEADVKKAASQQAQAAKAEASKAAAEQAKKAQSQATQAAAKQAQAAQAKAEQAAAQQAQAAQAKAKQAAAQQAEAAQAKAEQAAAQQAQAAQAKATQAAAKQAKAAQNQAGQAAAQKTQAAQNQAKQAAAKQAQAGAAAAQAAGTTAPSSPSMPGPAPSVAPASTPAPAAAPSSGSSFAPAMARAPTSGVAGTLSRLATGAIDKADFAFNVSDGGDAEWHVAGLRLVEAIGEPYRLEVDLVTEDLAADLEQLVGASAELVIERDPNVNPVFGIIAGVEYRGAIYDRIVVRVSVVPALALLQHRVDSRIFQDLTVVEIISAVLDADLGPYERSYRFATQATYSKRDYCVQFRESDLAFVTRLCQEEGILFYFEQADGGEVVVFVDRNEDFPEVANVDGTPEIPIIEDRQDQADVESIQGFEYGHAMGPTSVVTREFDWQQPTTPLVHELRVPDTRGKEREVYRVSGRRWILDDGDLRTRYALELAQADQVRGHGHSNVTGLRAGSIFQLAEHGRADLDGRTFLVTQITHSAHCPEVMLATSGDDSPRGSDRAPRYENAFHCIPVEVPYRRRNAGPKPQMLGPQTGTVTGPGGEEIHTDEYGRVKVKFHWDRLQPDDDTSSCWIRVVQPWAGLGWGSVFIPRVGMEVVVSFIEGDPDRPIVSGAVYNGSNTLPLDLPSDKTKSTIKSNSSPGGGGYNELTFEDSAGHEQIILHAQKDLNETVLNDHSTTVKASQTNSVSGSQTESVGGDQSMTVSGARTATVKKNEIITIEGSQSFTIKGGQAANGVTGGRLDITGEYQVETSDKVHIKAPTSITLECGGSKIVMEPGKIEMIAGGGAKFVLDQNADLKAQPGAHLNMTADLVMEATAKGKLQLDANAQLQSAAGAKIQLDANASMTTNANVTIEGATCTMQSTGGVAVCKVAGPMASLEGTAMCEVKCGGASIQATPPMVMVTAGTVKLN